MKDILQIVATIIGIIEGTMKIIMFIHWLFFIARTKK